MSNPLKWHGGKSYPMLRDSPMKPSEALRSYQVDPQADYTDLQMLKEDFQIVIAAVETLEQLPGAVQRGGMYMSTCAQCQLPVVTLVPQDLVMRCEQCSEVQK